MEHSREYKFRRFLNWFPLGLVYALLYMGRYNLTVSKVALGDLMSNETFGTIFGVGAWVYALSFLINGPLVDKIGGKKGILIGGIGACLMNFLMGIYLWYAMHQSDLNSASIGVVFTVLYGLNMYFQSYGAVAIVKVNAPWFHVTERGKFSGIFGIMIASGLYFAFDVSGYILKLVAGKGVEGIADGTAVWWIFYAPAILLALFCFIELFLLKNTPAEAGFANFDTADASSGEGQEQPSVFLVLKKILTNPIILTIALVEFCTGVIRQGVMHWPLIFAEEHIKAGLSGGWEFLKERSGLIFMVAGIIGGMVGGYVSDKLFQSRRAPSAVFFYALAFSGAVGIWLFLENGWAISFFVFLMSICVIGTHGLLSGTAAMDFGGTKGAATAVGLIDGCVYLGTGVQSLALGYITTRNWSMWPVFLAPFCLIGFLLLLRIWGALPSRSKSKAP